MKGKEAIILQRIGIILALLIGAYAVCCDLTEPHKVMPVVVVKAEERNEEELDIEDPEEDRISRELYWKRVADLTLMAKCIEAEAGNQSLLGKRLVADVILNRVDDPEYPDGIREVIEQKGQFAVVGNGTIRTTTPTEETWRAVFLEAAGERVDSEIIFFNCGGYLSCGEPWEKVGDHYFSTKGD